MKSIISIAALSILVPCVAAAQKLGDHPAIVVQRLQATAGYDYASKFYPHPAWLHLSAEAPHPMSDHPAVIIARKLQQERQAEEEAVKARLAQR